MSTVRARCLDNGPSNIIETTQQFVEELREQKAQMQDQPSNFFSDLWRNKLIKLVFFDKIASNVTPHYLYRAKILSENPFSSKTDYLSDLQAAKPASFYGAYGLSSAVMIRSVGQANVRK